MVAQAGRAGVFPLFGRQQLLLAVDVPLNLLGDVAEDGPHLCVLIQRPSRLQRVDPHADCLSVLQMLAGCVPCGGHAWAGVFDLEDEGAHRANLPASSRSCAIVPRTTYRLRQDASAAARWHSMQLPAWPSVLRASR